MDAYKKLEELNMKLYRLRHMTALAMWDARVMMPPKGAPARAAAMAEISQIMHNMFVCPETKALIEAAEKAMDEMTPAQQANLRETKRKYENESILSADFVGRKIAITTESQHAWAKCRANNDFASFLPHYEKVIAIVREEAQIRSKATGLSPYAALVDVNEPGFTLEALEELYADIKSWLPKLLRDIQESRKNVEASVVPLQGPFPLDKQEALSRKLLEVWGFDFEAGRLDRAPHPFGGMVKEDSRVTTHYSEADYQKSVFATIHEAGHSNYETHMGPRDMRGQPVCEARSGGIHESQSRFQEVIVGRGKDHAEFLTPLLKEYFGDQPAFTVENVRKIHQHVQPGFIRVAADEVCYQLHVLLRYEIERDIVEGKMEAAEVPAAWNAKMKEYLGLDTEGRDDIGCLQDVHWHKGGFGSFPAYTIGSIFAAQMMAMLKKELGEDTIRKCILSGDYSPIAAKREEKVWGQGCLHSMQDLMVKATGEKFTVKYFREHLERRYLRMED